MGKPNTGKSTSLMNLHNQNKMVYLNTDLKELPFKSRFIKNVEVADALDVLAYIKEIEQRKRKTLIKLTNLNLPQQCKISLKSQ